MKARSLKKNILLALHENNKSMTRTGIYGELPDDHLPKTVEGVSAALFHMKQEQHVRPGQAGAWSLTKKGLALAKELAKEAGQCQS
ncbi:MAG: hypothetical protein RPU39_13645 [Candidatus Sedimenticola sp. (ex Thyasira tokunagai)]